MLNIVDILFKTVDTRKCGTVRVMSGCVCFFLGKKKETRNICHGNIGTLWIQTEIDRNTVDNGKSEGKNINNDHRAEDMKRNQVTFFFPQPTQKSSG